MAMQPLIQIQQGMAEVGRIRLGEKSEKGAPKKLATFRLTSSNKRALDAAAKLYGGTVREWKDAPSAGQYELLTQATELNVIIPPVPRLCSQFYEMWAAGGCTRRCDGETEMISGEPCKCDPEADAKNRCKITTRISVMLPELPGVGLWRLESHGWNAARTLPGTVALFARTGKFIPAVLRADQRTEKKNNQTRKFIVPVIDFPDFTLGKMIEHEPTLLLGGPAPQDRGARVERPALPDAPDLPDENPDWEGSPARSDQFRKIMGAMESVAAPGLGAWAVKMGTAIDRLPENERQIVKEEIARRSGLPF